MKHASARNVIERAFGLLKVRWGAMAKGTHFNIKTQTNIILACCYLHNLIRQQMRVDPFEAQLQEIHEEYDQNTNEEYITTCETSNQWTNFRDNLAQEMYNSWLARR